MTLASALSCTAEMMKGLVRAGLRDIMGGDGKMRFQAI